MRRRVFIVAGMIVALATLAWAAWAQSGPVPPAGPGHMGQVGQQMPMGQPMPMGQSMMQMQQQMGQMQQRMAQMDAQVKAMRATLGKINPDLLTQQERLMYDYLTMAQGLLETGVGTMGQMMRGMGGMMPGTPRR